MVLVWLKPPRQRRLVVYLVAFPYSRQQAAHLLSEPKHWIYCDTSVALDSSSLLLLSSSSSLLLLLLLPLALS